jgi:hypothetical protein
MHRSAHNHLHQLAHARNREQQKQIGHVPVDLRVEIKLEAPHTIDATLSA